MDQELIGRIRINENRINLLREKLLVTDNNMISTQKELRKDLKELTTEIREIKKEIFLLKETLRDTIKEIHTFAKKTDIKTLEKYINLWDPMKFTTEEEVKKIIKEQNAR
tara:strand:- start:91 stop:420 length:330 start_codon:yes stop_codon:yes gene_type:complete